jgi:hypothetical protein
LLVMDTVPLAVPVAAGLKLTSRVTYWPGTTVTPVPIPLVVKPGPVIEFCCSVSGPTPVLAKVTPSSVVAPTATSPKFRVELYIVKVGVSCGCAVGDPPQPAVASAAPKRPVYNQLIFIFITNLRSKPPAYVPILSNNQLGKIEFLFEIIAGHDGTGDFPAMISTLRQRAG